MSSIFITPHEMALNIANQAKIKRLSMDMSQKSLGERSGVSLGTLKNFERTGQISLSSLLKIALTLQCLDNFQELFLVKPSLLSLEALVHDKTRKRGRQ
jgi:transcriptional regulator with XRE-family HTH domain